MYQKSLLLLDHFVYYYFPRFSSIFINIFFFHHACRPFGPPDFPEMLAKSLCEQKRYFDYPVARSERNEKRLGVQATPKANH